MEGVKQCRFGGSRSVCARESYQRYGVASSSDFSMAKNPSHKNTMPENRTKNRKLAAKHCRSNVATEFTRNEPTALPTSGGNVRGLSLLSQSPSKTEDNCRTHENAAGDISGGFRRRWEGVGQPHPLLAQNFLSMSRRFLYKKQIVRCVHLR